MGRILAIDYGDVRIGIAVTDERKILALPVGIIKASKTPRATAEALAKQVAGYGTIDKIVIGLPLLLNGKEGDMALKVRAFAQILKEVFNVEVAFLDERLTSLQVNKLMIEAGVKRKKRGLYVDAMAAATILQTFLSIP